MQMCRTWNAARDNEVGQRSNGLTELVGQGLQPGDLPGFDRLHVIPLSLLLWKSQVGCQLDQLSLDHWQLLPQAWTHTVGQRYAEEGVQLIHCANSVPP